ncbi:MAG: ABC transporter substrate-binding protein [Candidatus Bipolaricaulota bacterium]|nr:ABC transporter substrate-binding protein [Candidatus Bipolaricaulota bacterium]
MRLKVASITVLLVALLLIPAGLAAQDTIKIGFFAPLTGFAAADGASALAGAQTAVDFINDAGGINGKPVELVYYDDGCKADEASSIARKLIERDKVVVGVSGSYSTPTRAAAGIFQAAGVPLISSYAVHPSITKAGDLVFRVGMDASTEGWAGAELVVKQLGAKEIAVLTIDNDFGVSLGEYFKERAEKFGGTIVFEKRYPLGESEFRDVLGSIKDEDPEILWASGYYAEAANIVSQAKELDIRCWIVGQEGYDSPKFVELSTDTSAYGTLIVTDLNRDSDREIVQSFLAEYCNRTGLDADMVGASAFDAVQVAAYGIENGGVTAEEIRDAINGIENFENAVTGPFYGFSERRVIKPITVQIIRNGEFHFFMEFTDPDIITPAP